MQASNPLAPSRMGENAPPPTTPQHMRASIGCPTAPRFARFANSRTFSWPVFPEADGIARSKFTFDKHFGVPTCSIVACVGVDGSERAVGEGSLDGSARGSRTRQSGSDGTHLEHVTFGEVSKGEPLDEHVLTDVAWTNRMTFLTKGLQHLKAPQTKGACGTAVMLQIALAITDASALRHGKGRHGGFGHATFRCGMKRDHARFGDHAAHSA